MKIEEIHLNKNHGMHKYAIATCTCDEKIKWELKHSYQWLECATY